MHRKERNAMGNANSKLKKKKENTPAVSDRSTDMRIFIRQLSWSIVETFLEFS